MKIKWLVQDIGKTVMLNDNFGTLKELNYLYQGFGLIEGSNFISNIENILNDLDEKYIIRGGTKIISLLENFDNLESISQNLNSFQSEHSSIFLQKIKDGVFYNSTSFDQAFYNTLDLPLLNKEAFFLPIKNHKDTTFDIPYFIKPSQDLKTFIPGIIQPGQSIQNFIENSQHHKNYDHELALISPLKNILKEYRFFIINEKVITGSQYKNFDKVEYNSFTPENILKTAQEYAKLYQPHDVFTMDLAETDNEIKIVEYNCWNGSGLYFSDKKLIFKEVQDYIINAPKKCIPLKNNNF